MVLDFSDLKAMMQEIVGPFDHQVINDIPPFDERNTTAELISQYVFEEIERRLQGQERVRVVRVEVWETETSCAAYER
jgi:6-pyruvoyltetrahydropterin/6-carboxytetrahydropterin synthase